MAQNRFQCPECGMGDHEVGPMAETGIHCIVCLEEHGRAIRLHCWEEEPAQARFARGLARRLSSGRRAFGCRFSFAVPCQLFVRLLVSEALPCLAWDAMC